MTSTTNQNGAQLLVKCLEAHEVSSVWGYPGGAIMPVYDALLDSSIRHYLPRHEQGAGFAAAGAARALGRPAVCIATSGPGATNLVTAIADCRLDSVPLVAITGQTPWPLIGTDAFQEADVIGITMPIVKHSWQPRSAEELPRIVHDAFQVAAEGRPGPVLIDLPKDVQLAPTSVTPFGPDLRGPRDLEEPDTDAVTEARHLMMSSTRPMIYAGGGVRMAGAWEALREFAEATGAPVVTTLHGVGAIPHDHPQNLGMLGMHGMRAANQAVQECDLLIAIGARFDDRVTGKLDAFAPEAAVIHMDIDAAELGKIRRPHAALRGDLRVSMRMVGRPISCDAWRSRVERLRAEHAWSYEAPEGTLSAPRMLRDLSRRCPANTFVASDVGQHQMWVAQHFGFDNPRRHLSSGGLGTMGFGLPAAMGVKIAAPEANVICVSGDGSIMMNIQELATLRRYGIGVKILLFDNGALGMVRQWQELFFDGRESEVDLSDNPDFGAVARAFGVDSMSVERPGEAAEAIEALATHPGPLLVHAKIERGANVWPLVPPGRSNAEMLDENPAERPAGVR